MDGRSNAVGGGGGAETISATINGVSGGIIPTSLDVAWFDGEEGHYERVVTPKTINIAKGSVFVMAPTLSVPPPESAASPVGGGLEGAYFANDNFVVWR